MKATGEVMAIDRSFEAAFQKAVRSLEITNRSLLWEHADWTAERTPLHPHDQRLWALLASLRRGTTAEDLSRTTGIDPWFTRAFARIADMERRLLSSTLTADLMWDAKRLGFSDAKIGVLSDRTPDQVRTLRRGWGITPVYKMVDTCAAEFEAETPYFYSTYEQENEAAPMPGRKAVVIGSGPIRIGQGIEFDYCSVHAAWALQQAGVKSVLINSNPETVSTDFDTSDRLYFEPLDEESVLDVLDNETRVDGGEESVPPSVVQFGGQTAINLSQTLAGAGLPILGSTAHSIDVASDRHLFEDFLSQVGIPNPPGSAVANVDQAVTVADAIGYPVLVRPSYVLGGRAMEIVRDDRELHRYMTDALAAGEGRRVLIDKYFEGREVEVDAVCDGESVLIPGIMEHVERAGVHSGDSMAIYPGLTLTSEEIDTVVDYTTRIGRALDVRGLMNIQFVVLGGSGVSKPGAGQRRKGRGRHRGLRPGGQPPLQPDDTVHLQGDRRADGPPRHQRHAGQVPRRAGLPGRPVEEAGPRRRQGAGLLDVQAGRRRHLPRPRDEVDRRGHRARLRVRPRRHQGAHGRRAHAARRRRHPAQHRQGQGRLAADGPTWPPPATGYATSGTAAMIRGQGIDAVEVPKLDEGGRPNVVDVIADGAVDAVVNTLTGDREALKDGFEIRREAVERRIPCFTSLDTARARRKPHQRHRRLQRQAPAHLPRRPLTRQACPSSDQEKASGGYGGVPSPQRRPRHNRADGTVDAVQSDPQLQHRSPAPPASALKDALRNPPRGRRDERPRRVAYGAASTRASLATRPAQPVDFDKPGHHERRRSSPRNVKPASAHLPQRPGCDAAGGVSPKSRGSR